MPTTDKGLLEAALIGYEAQKAKIEASIAAIRQQLRDGGLPATFPNTVVPKKKRTMSAAARKRIAAAQKKRWADYHAEQKKD